VPHCQSDSLDQALDAAGVPSDYTLIPGAGHGWPDEIEQADMVVFFQTYLDEIVGVPEHEIGSGPKISAPVTMLPNYPNPFRERTTVRLELVEPSVVTLEIFDVKGRVVRSLLTEWRDSGSHSLGWNGRDATGRRVPAGVYFSRVRAGSHSVQQRLLMVR
jgi:hypothetical protein